jgi:hypothetical protein
LTPAGRFLAALLAGFYLWLSLVAVDHDLHHYWHAEAGQSDHHCVLTLLGQSQVDLDPPVPEAVVSCDVAFAPARFTVVVPPSIPHALPPGRGPPAG